MDSPKTDSLMQDNIRQARDFISRHYGIHHPADRLADLDKKLTQIAQRLGYAHQYELIRTLLSGDLSGDKSQQLVEALTVGETYFFREPHAIEALLHAILPDIQQQQGRRLRLWSAGCASGEEPYSLAMALDSHCREPHQWDISILATDINQQSLQKAIQGNYTAWSFRTTPTHYKQRYFYPQTDGSFLLDSRIKQMVQFSQLNLAQHDYPSPANGTHQVDVIFCRNVLMYFSPQTITQIVERFSRSLTPNGWLIISQTECSHYFQQEFETIQIGQAFLFRKRNTPTARPFSPTLSDHAIFNATPTQCTTNLSPILPAALPSVLASTVLQPINKTSDEFLEQAKTFANQGRLEEACAQCQAALAKQKLNAYGHYLHAMILQELSRPEEAREALRRVLYLQPNMVMALYTLANLEQQQGHRREALRHFDNAFRIISVYEDDSLIPHSEGLSAGQLRELLMQLRMEG
jgi:chemotaxis protein methyltransferase CheR